MYVILNFFFFGLSVKYCCSLLLLLYLLWVLLRLWLFVTTDFMYGYRCCSLPTQDLTSTVTGLELGDPPPLAVSRVASVIEKLKTNPNLSTYLATPKALCGRVTNVVIWEEDHWKLIRDNVPIGSFIRLRNVEIKQWRRNHFRCKFSSVTLVRMGKVQIVVAMEFLLF